MAAYVRFARSTGYGQLYFRFYPETLDGIVGFHSDRGEYCIECSIEQLQEYGMVTEGGYYTYTLSEEEENWVYNHFEKLVDKHTKESVNGTHN